MKLRFVAVPVLAAGLALGSVGTAFAADSPTADSPTATTAPAKPELTDAQKARLQLACTRIPNLISRTENLQKRLPADANTRGSIAWVEAKADKAEAAGHADLATVLRNRTDVMKAKEATLDAQLAALKNAQTACSEHGA
jgi:hypothetical protein